MALAHIVPVLEDKEVPVSVVAMGWFVDFPQPTRRRVIEVRSATKLSFFMQYFVMKLKFIRD